MSARPAGAPSAPTSAHLSRPNALVLAIESSCEETAAAVMHGGNELLANIVASQIDFHARFGGVVPEIASRKHTEAIVGVVDEALEREEQRSGEGGRCASASSTRSWSPTGPGSVGALVVGCVREGARPCHGRALVGVNHLKGHLFANVFADPP